MIKRIIQIALAIPVFCFVALSWLSVFGIASLRFDETFGGLIMTIISIFTIIILEPKSD